MKYFLDIKNFYIFIFIFSLLSLLVVLYIEFFLGYQPCKLCIYQRIPYLIAIFFTFLGISYYKNLTWLYLLLIIFISSFLLSGYHFGIEQGIFEEFAGCVAGSMDITTKDELLKSLNSDLKSCKNVDFTIFGLSLAAINFLLSFLICILILKVLKNEKNK